MELGFGSRFKEPQGLSYEATWHCHPNTMEFWTCGYMSRHSMYGTAGYRSPYKHGGLRMECDQQNRAGSEELTQRTSGTPGRPMLMIQC